MVCMLAAPPVRFCTPHSHRNLGALGCVCTLSNWQVHKVLAGCQFCASLHNLH